MQLRFGGMRKLREQLKAGPNAFYELGSIATRLRTCQVTHSPKFMGRLGQLLAPHMLLAHSWQHHIAHSGRLAAEAWRGGASLGC